MRTSSVSVVIPAYNCELYLARAIDSALNQTYPPAECIVINDGSTDGTAAVVAAYGTRVIHIDQPNRGASAARNAGIARATGSFIAFLDADDYWHPSKLAKQLALMEAHPELVLVSTALAWLDRGEASLARNWELAELPCSDELVDFHTDFLPLFRNPYLGTPSVIVRAENAREVGGFDEGLPVAEDLDFYFRVCRGHAYARIQQPLTFVEVRKGSLTRTNNPGFRINLEVLDRVEQRDPEFARVYAHEFTRQRLSIYENWVSKALVLGNGPRARTVLRESRRYGRMTPYYRYLIKSVFAGPIRTVREWRARTFIRSTS